MTSLTKARLALAAAALLWQACSSVAGLPPQPDPPRFEYRIGPEDVIEVVVWNNDAVSRTVPVRPDGMISLPLVNDVRVAGLTALELREELTVAFRKFMPAPDVFVIVQEINSPKVVVLGEVVHPGRYVIRGPTTLLDIVAQAGGLTEFASGSDATIMRVRDGKTQRFGVDARGDEADDTDLAVSVQPGDVIVIP